MNQILEKDDFTLEELLDEDDFIQEAQAQTPNLIKALTRKEIIQRMIYYLVVPHSPGEENRCYRYPYMISEAICCNVPRILDAFVDEHTQKLEAELEDGVYREDLNLLLFMSYLNPGWRKRYAKHFPFAMGKDSCVLDDPLVADQAASSKALYILRSYQASYFGKVAEFLIAKRPVRMMQFFDRNPGIFSQMCLFLYDYSIVSLLKQTILLSFPPNSGMTTTLSLGNSEALQNGGQMFTLRDDLLKHNLDASWIDFLAEKEHSIPTTGLRLITELVREVCNIAFDSPNSASSQSLEAHIESAKGIVDVFSHCLTYARSSIAAPVYAAQVTSQQEKLPKREVVDTVDHISDMPLRTSVEAVSSSLHRDNMWTDASFFSHLFTDDVTDSWSLKGPLLHPTVLMAKYMLENSSFLEGLFDNLEHIVDFAQSLPLPLPNPVQQTVSILADLTSKLIDFATATIENCPEYKAKNFEFPLLNVLRTRTKGIQSAIVFLQNQIVSVLPTVLCSLSSESTIDARCEQKNLPSSEIKLRKSKGKEAWLARLAAKRSPSSGETDGPSSPLDSDVTPHCGRSPIPRSKPGMTPVPTYTDGLPMNQSCLQVVRLLCSILKSAILERNSDSPESKTLTNLIVEAWRTLLVSMVAYPWHSTLHNVVTDAVDYTFEAENRQMQQLLLLTDVQLLHFLSWWSIQGGMSSTIAPESEQKVPTRAGYLGHFATIASHVLSYSVQRQMQLSSFHSDEKALNLWNTFVTTYLPATIMRRSILLGGALPPDAKSSGNIGANADAVGGSGTVDEVESDSGDDKSTTSSMAEVENVVLDLTAADLEHEGPTTPVALTRAHLKHVLESQFHTHSDMWPLTFLCAAH